MRNSSEIALIQERLDIHMGNAELLDPRVRVLLEGVTRTLAWLSDEIKDDSPWDDLYSVFGEDVDMYELMDACSPDVREPLSTARPFGMEGMTRQIMREHTIEHTCDYARFRYSTKHGEHLHETLDNGTAPGWVERFAAECEAGQWLEVPAEPATEVEA